MTLAPGIHDEIPADAYHSDPTEEPALSASIANFLISQSPAHAWAKHPKNPARVPEEREERFEVGTVVHELFLRGVNLIEIVPHADWRTKAAKEARDEARQYGRIPLLPDQAQRVTQMVDAIREQLDAHSADPPLFTEGKPEQTLVWDDDHGVTCRARLDWLRDDYSACDDLKTTSVSANPRAWRKTMWSIGAAFQAQFYRRGVEKLTGVRPAFRFAVVETQPPFALSVVSLDPQAEAVADAQIEWALQRWAGCVEFNDWPAYTREIAYIDCPGYVEAEWLERSWGEKEAAT